MHDLPLGQTRTRALGHLVYYYRMLNLTYLPTGIKTVYLKIGDNGTVQYPSDYIRYEKIGVLFQNKIWTLTKRSGITVPGVSECNLPIESAANQSNAEDVYGRLYFTPHYDRNGNYIGRMYGVGGGFNSEGYFSEDKENKRFIFDQVNAKDIVLEYKYHGVDENTVVPTEAINAMIAYLHQAMMAKDRTANAYLIRKAEEDFALAESNMDLSLNPFDMDEYLDSFYKDVYLSPKR